jgi:hypothetical protein
MELENCKHGRKKGSRLNVESEKAADFTVPALAACQRTAVPLQQ